MARARTARAETWWFPLKAASEQIDPLAWAAAARLPASASRDGGTGPRAPSPVSCAGPYSSAEWGLLLSVFLHVAAVAAVLAFGLARTDPPSLALDAGEQAATPSLTMLSPEQLADLDRPPQPLDNAVPPNVEPAPPAPPKATAAIDPLTPPRTPVDVVASAMQPAADATHRPRPLPEHAPPSKPAPDPPAPTHAPASLPAPPPSPTPDSNPPADDPPQQPRDEPAASPAQQPPASASEPHADSAPAAPAAPTDPGVDAEPTPDNLPAPIYPPRSRRLGEQGTVVLSATIGHEGRPSDIRVERSPGHQRLVDAAVDALRRARFTPATRAGQPVPHRITIPFRFQLR
mgnify:CR=1 FL=1